MLALAHLLWLIGIAYAAPTFGPEVEFRGAKQVPALLCAAALYEGPQQSIQNLAKRSAVVGAVFVAASGSDTPDPAANSGTGAWAGVPFGAVAGFAYLYAALCPMIREISDDAYDKTLEEALRTMCAARKCQIAETKQPTFWRKKPYRDFTVTYPDGFAVHFTHDPSVIEVKTNPLSAESMRANSARMQTDIWDLLRGLGLRPPKLDGVWNGGHLHIGVKESFQNVLHLKTFLRDLLEHPELAEGILGHDPIEGLSPWEGDGGYRIRSVLEALDRLPDDAPVEHAFFALALFKRDGYGIHFNRNLGTLELRFLRSQGSAQTMERLIRLLNSRINYLRTHHYVKRALEPLVSIFIRARQETKALGNASSTQHFEWVKRFATDLVNKHPGTDAEKEQAFRRYVEECGESWDEYKQLPLPFLRRKFSNVSAACFLLFRNLIL